MLSRAAGQNGKQPTTRWKRNKSHPKSFSGTKSRARTAVIEMALVGQDKKGLHELLAAQGFVMQNRQFMSYPAKTWGNEPLKPS